MGETSAMSALLSDIGLIVAQIMTNIGTICTTITGQPLLLLTVGFLFIGGCVGIFGRFLSRG